MRGAAREHNAAGRAREATVIGRWGDDMALLRIDGGGTIEASVPAPLRDRVDVGARVEVMDNGAVDWRLPDDPGQEA